VGSSSRLAIVINYFSIIQIAMVREGMFGTGVKGKWGQGENWRKCGRGWGEGRCGVSVRFCS
jgi:hypothetical protein